MADQLQLRGGTTSEHSTFTGALREVTVDTDKDTVVVHDGSTAGGHPLLRQDLSNLPAGTIDNADISASAEIAVSKLADGAARQLLQTDAAGTGVEWTDNVDVPGTLDVTGAATFDSSVAVTGTLTKSGNNVVTVGDTGTVTSTMIADGTIVNADVNASAAIAGTKISPDFGSQTISTTGVVSHALGTAGAPTLTFTGDTNTGIYSPGADQVAISTGGSGRLFIDSSGNVGIGTSSPHGNSGTNLHIHGSNTTAELRLTNTTTGTGANGSIIQQGGNSLYISNSEAGNVVFENNGSERLRITSAGLVGIGTSSPSALLHIVSGDAIQIIENSAATSNASIQLKYPSRTWSIANRGADLSGSLTFRDITAGADRVVIDSSGRVGIGTTAPTRLLTVQSTGNADICIKGPNTSTSQLLFADTDSDTPGVISYNHSTNNMVFEVNAAERARIDSSGRLLVGTSTALSNINYAGADRTPSVQFQGADASQGSFSFTRTETNCLVYINGGASGRNVANNENLGNLIFTGYHTDKYYTGAQIQAAADGTTGAGDMPTRLVFSTTADGASSPTERMRIAQDGACQYYANTAFNVRTARTSTTADAFSVHKGASSTTTGTLVFQVMADGDCENTNNAYGAISDVKLKENIVDANSQWDDLKALQVRNYSFKKETRYETHRQIGLIAQEVELVSPGLVSESPDRDAEGNDLGTVTKSVNYSVLYMKAVKALQEAMERIEQLEAKVAALESA